MNKVLVIDDDAELRAALVERLRDAGFEISEAADGAQGLKLQRDDPADIVVTDIFMPDQDGMETVSKLRSIYPEIKIIAISGGMARDGKCNYLPVAKLIGADRCLQKPFKAAELVSTVRELLETATPESQAPDAGLDCPLNGGDAFLADERPPSFPRIS